MLPSLFPPDISYILNHYLIQGNKISLRPKDNTLLSFLSLISPCVQPLRSFYRLIIIYERVLKFYTLKEIELLNYCQNQKRMVDSAYNLYIVFWPENCWIFESSVARCIVTMSVAKHVLYGPRERIITVDGYPTKAQEQDKLM
jgi:hypothetical protein